MLSRLRTRTRLAVALAATALALGVAQAPASAGENGAQWFRDGYSLNPSCTYVSGDYWDTQWAPGHYDAGYSLTVQDLCVPGNGVGHLRLRYQQYSGGAWHSVPAGGGWTTIASTSASGNPHAAITLYNVRNVQFNVCDYIAGANVNCAQMP
ncbi:hypothetical protein ACFYT4_33565 [Streptomyces sp. NPDC004609]|uniref:hypothetical protein n=1 Tax=Streptomyces sp. NPDC004609 TaxID=3364704 RepID=UPI0036BD493F